MRRYDHLEKGFSEAIAFARGTVGVWRGDLAAGILVQAEVLAERTAQYADLCDLEQVLNLWVAANNLLRLSGEIAPEMKEHIGRARQGALMETADGLRGCMSKEGKP